MPRVAADPVHRPRAPLRVVLPLLAVSALTSACGEQPISLTVVLQRHNEGLPDEAVLENLNGLSVRVREICSSLPQVFETFAMDRSTQVELPATVPPDTPFFVDVWGCSVTSDCQPADVVARGCTEEPLTLSAEDEPHVITVAMRDARTEAERNAVPCLPPIPPGLCDE